VVSVGAPIEEMLENPNRQKWMAYPVEFCGGTHLKRTGEAGLFCIIEEAGVAKGIRRITAVSGDRAAECDRLARELRNEFDALSKLADDELAKRLPEFVKRVSDETYSYLAKIELREKLPELQTRLKAFSKRQARSSAGDARAAAERLLAEAPKVGASRIIVGEMPPAGAEQIREAIDFLRDKAGSAGIFLGCPAGDKVLLFASMTDDLVAEGLKAGDLIREVAPIVKGGGGGKAELAQAGGKDPSALPQALERAREWLRAQLSDDAAP
jgi:alanyl-tRNA synthetase